MIADEPLLHPVAYHSLDVAAAAVDALTRSTCESLASWPGCLADQLRPFSVTENAIAPGDTRTERFLATRAVDPARLVEDGTLDRIATVDEVARVVEFFSGDCALLPAGTGHRRLDASIDFQVVGAYPPDQRCDLQQSAIAKEAIERMAQLQFPSLDPVMGTTGPLLQFWKPAG